MMNILPRLADWHGSYLAQAPDADAIVVAFLRSDRIDIDAAAACLNADESARAARFHHQRDRRDFVVARAALRDLLGACRGEPAATVQLAYEPAGKPFLVADPALHFNVSHSAGVCALVVTRVGRVGIDIEEIVTGSDVVNDIAGQLADDERDALAACAPDQRNAHFFSLWTLKEAYAKARGDGLSLPLDSYAFVLDGEHIAFRSEHDNAGAWQFRSGLVFERWRWALALVAPPSQSIRLRLLFAD